MSGNKIEFKLRVNITGDISEEKKLKWIVFNHPDLNVIITQPGTYEFHAPVSDSHLGFWVEGFSSNESCNITIEQVPQYPNALVSDGVDDYACVEGMPVLTDYTIIAKRTIFEGSAGAIAAKSEERGIDINAAISNLMNATKSNIQSYNMANKEVNQLVDMYPKWEDLIGQTLEAGFKLQYNGKPYRVIQAHTTQSDWKPDEVKSLYNLISNHNGTKEDPIPYERWLVLDKDLYYIENDTLYLCVTSSIVGYDSDLAQLGALVQKIEQ